MSQQTDTPKEKIYYDQRSVALRTTQSVYFVEDHDKISILELLLNDYKEVQTVIVVKSKKKADALSEFLISKEFQALCVHGNHREEKKQDTVSNFNLGILNIIITTEMILKKLELENIKLFISYDLPSNPQDYYNNLFLMKELGVAIALVSPQDKRLLSDIEFNMKKEIEEKILEGFVASQIPTHGIKRIKDIKKKPRHNKKRVKKAKDV